MQCADLVGSACDDLRCVDQRIRNATRLGEPTRGARSVRPVGVLLRSARGIAGHAAGDVIREQAFTPILSIPTATGAIPGSARRIMYRSVDDDGRPIPVSGTYFEPSTAWQGRGPRPLVSLASGTIGAGRQCAPSIAMQSLLHYRPPFDLSVAYEQLAVDYLLAQGIAVVFTDYVGLGTPGPHPYINRGYSARAVIDAARAAQRIPGTSLSTSGPVGFWATPRAAMPLRRRRSYSQLMRPS